MFPLSSYRSLSTLACILFLALGVLAPFQLVSPASAHYAGPSSTLQAYGSAVLDLSIDAGYSCIKYPPQTPPHAFIICEMNDQLYDYYFWAVYDPTFSENDNGGILFDNNHNGVVEQCQVVEDALYYVIRNNNLVGRDAHYCFQSPMPQLPPAFADASLDVIGLCQYDSTPLPLLQLQGPAYICEVRKPMNIGDIEDYALSPGSTVGWCSFHFDNGANSMFEYPVDCYSRARGQVQGGGDAGNYGHVVKLTNQQTTTTTQTISTSTTQSLPTDCSCAIDLSTGSINFTAKSAGSQENPAFSPFDWWQRMPNGTLVKPWVVNNAGPWASAPAGSMWLSPYIDSANYPASDAPADTNFTYSIIFTAPSPGVIYLRAASDDPSWFYLDGVYLGVNVLGYALYPQPQPSWWVIPVTQSGIHNLTAVVFNQPGGTPTGLLVDARFCARGEGVSTVTSTAATTVTATTTIGTTSTITSPVTTTVTSTILSTSTVTTTQTTTQQTVSTTTTISTLTTISATTETTMVTITATSTSIVIDPLLEIKLDIALPLLGAILALLTLMYLKCCKKKMHGGKGQGSPKEGDDDSRGSRGEEDSGQKSRKHGEIEELVIKTKSTPP